MTVTPSVIVIESVDSSGQTIFSNAESTVTLPTNATTIIETDLPNGMATTITPVTSTVTLSRETVVSDGQTTVNTVTATL